MPLREREVIIRPRESDESTAATLGVGLLALLIVLIFAIGALYMLNNRQQTLLDDTRTETPQLIPIPVPQSNPVPIPVPVPQSAPAPSPAPSAPPIDLNIEMPTPPATPSDTPSTPPAQ